MDWQTLQPMLIKEINNGVYDNKRQFYMRINYLENTYPEYKGELIAIVTDLKVKELTRQLIRNCAYKDLKNFRLIDETPFSATIILPGTTFKIVIQRVGDMVKVKVEGALQEGFNTYNASFMDFSKCFWKLENFMFQENINRRRVQQGVA